MDGNIEFRVFNDEYFVFGLIFIKFYCFLLFFDRIFLVDNV